MWSLRNIYLYLVCLISIVLIIVGLITFANSLTDLFLKDAYYQPKFERMTQYSPDMKITKEQYEAQIDREIEQYTINERNRKIRSTINSLSMLIVALPFYIYHWRRIQQDQQAQNPKELSM